MSRTRVTRAYYIKAPRGSKIDKTQVDRLDKDHERDGPAPVAGAAGPAVARWSERCRMAVADLSSTVSCGIGTWGGAPVVMPRGCNHVGEPR